MANIRICEKSPKIFEVTVDEYPEISFTEKSYKRARDKAVELVKTELAKIPSPQVNVKEKSSKISIGFAA